MKRFKGALIMVAAVVCLVSVFAAYNCEAASKFTKGMNLAAKWTDGNYYLAKISSVKGDKYEVDYADGTKGTVSAADLKEIPAKLKLAKGDKVLAVWAGAKFYSGTVLEVKPNGAIVKWDDGSTPSFAPFGKIMK